MGKKKLNNKYEAMGFAEALIALMIAGMVGIVLMKISASTLRELAQLDIQDSIAQHAVSAGVDLQRIAIADMERDTKEFFEIDGFENKCFQISQDGTQILGPYIECDSFTRSDLIRILENGEETDYFRIFRVVQNDGKKAILEIRTGSYKLAGISTTSRDIKDYYYLVVIAK